ncbi:hypothetical protein TNIN_323881 [Trichonephila inaurata madagascariensis]|uniref:Uncharacterized protein n=1 Tax=Trichonephila inaurata madagascariensis TaxID=2747483 RepID=A0A8X7BY00_9ARAC|nr:hypothetical protein TNIN_323881 [Trichonephila inaurata madagascariensis]
MIALDFDWLKIRTKISRHWSQGRLETFGVPFLGSAEAAHFILYMNLLTLDIDAVSSVTHTNQGRAEGLGRGPRSSTTVSSSFDYKYSMNDAISIFN